jgi:lipopolysaccharide/colanic/teichoic acid biosynthesis glycosyltransferase
MLVLSAPLLAIAAILIRLESRGPVLYRQERVGKNYRRRQRRRNPGGTDAHPPMNRRQGDRRRNDLGGRPFVIYKLRSMTVDAEVSTGAAWSTGDCDPRVTNVGHYIRKTHVDELPQLINVLFGDMSVIGPRPERPVFVEELSAAIDGYRDRLSVQPGITGLAQVRQAPDESLDDVRRKLEYDKEYVRNASILWDAKIVLGTIALTFCLLRSTLQGRTNEKAEPKTLEVLASEGVQSERA